MPATKPETGDNISLTFHLLKHYTKNRFEKNHIAILQKKKIKVFFFHAANLLILRFFQTFFLIESTKLLTMSSECKGVGVILSLSVPLGTVG